VKQGQQGSSWKSSAVSGCSRMHTPRVQQGQNNTQPTQQAAVTVQRNQSPSCTNNKPKLLQLASFLLTLRHSQFSGNNWVVKLFILQPAIVVRKIREILKMRRVSGRWRCGSLPRDAGDLETPTYLPRADFHFLLHRLLMRKTTHFSYSTGLPQ